MSTSSAFKYLHGGRPIDSLARRVAGKGERHDVYPGRGESDTPFQMWPWRGRGCRKADDLTGSKRGLLTVVGYAAQEGRWTSGGEAPTPRSGAGSLWVVRCVCGTYAKRRSKRWKKPGWDACSRCKAKRARAGLPMVGEL